MSVVCTDFGSTFTKITVVDEQTGALLATASTPTTGGSDVLDGFDHALKLAGETVSGLADARVLACSSAGGGLRLAVIGYERSITAEAGYRVGLSAGARVVHVFSGSLSASDIGAVLQDRPDVLLLVGGTDGGNAEVLTSNAHAIARAKIAVPVVVAGNEVARDQVVRILRRSGAPTHACPNVLPFIGMLDPGPARNAIREVFIEHVIGGKHLSSRVDLSTFVSAATPDAVLAGVELLADGVDGLPGVGDVVVVDVGGATTDVYSVVTPDAEQAGLDNEAVSMMWRSRTVEGDLGVRWNAVGVVEAARTERLIDDEVLAELLPEAERRAAKPDLIPSDEKGRQVDRELVRLAATVALRRHARPQESGEVRYPGKDLRHVRLIVGSGGVLRHSVLGDAERIVREVVNDPAGGWQAPERARVVVDSKYVLAAAGLLSRVDPRTAMRLLNGSLVDAGS